MYQPSAPLQRAEPEYAANFHASARAISAAQREPQQRQQECAPISLPSTGSSTHPE